MQNYTLFNCDGENLKKNRATGTGVGTFTVGNAYPIKLTIGDTVSLRVTVDGVFKVVDVLAGTSNTFFTAHLMG